MAATGIAGVVVALDCAAGTLLVPVGVTTNIDVAADTTALVQMLERGHHGVRLDAESWDRINTWIDLNRMGHGTWHETVGTNRVDHFAARRAPVAASHSSGARDLPARRMRAAFLSFMAHPYFFLASFMCTTSSAYLRPLPL